MYIYLPLSLSQSALYLSTCTSSSSSAYLADIFTGFFDIAEVQDVTVWAEGAAHADGDRVVVAVQRLSEAFVRHKMGTAELHIGRVYVHLIRPI